MPTFQEIQLRGLRKISSALDLELNFAHGQYNFELGLPLEGGLRHFFGPYFPHRYGFSSGYIVDDHDAVSNQTDWIIYDAEHFSPLLAQVHGAEGAEWFHFDAVYGCVEVKRTLTSGALDDAVKQISRTRTLRRAPTTLLQMSPYLALPPGLLNLAEGVTVDEVCNRLYAGIYAFLPGNFEDPVHLLNALQSYAATYGADHLPDFVAVHGRYFVRRVTVPPNSSSMVIDRFVDRSNAYVAISSGDLTAGVFYLDLLGQFANTLLSAKGHSNRILDFLQSTGLGNVRGVLRF